MIALLLTTLANAATPIVAAGNGLVAAPPAEFVKPEGEVASTWVSVLADCLEEARPQTFAVVDRSKEGATTGRLEKETQAIREIGASAVVLGVGALEMRDEEDPAAFVGRLTGVVTALRANDGPSVLLVGMVAPTLSQLEWSKDEDVGARQAAIDARTRAWNEALAKVAAADDGVWHVDLSWPVESGARKRLTRGGWALTDRAHARIGAVICEELLKKLKNEAP